MNRVNETAARKLRSLATAIRAEQYAPHDFGVRDEMEAQAVWMTRRADELDPPKPAIEEPTEFGSLIRASIHGAVYLWQRSPMQGKHYWESETGAVEVWPELSDVEVLRVGVGDNEAAPLRCIGGMLDHPEHAKRCPACSAKTDEAAYNNGVSDTVSALVARLQERRDETFNDWRAAFTEAIKIAEAL